MYAYFFWDIENISFHNLDKIMKHVDSNNNITKCYVVYAKIKEAHKEILTRNNWILCQTEKISKNSADKEIKAMIENILNEKSNEISKICIITEDKGFKKICKKILQQEIDLEIICATKNPSWINEL